MNRTIAMVVSRGWLSVCSFITFVIIGQTLTPASFGVFALASSLSLLPHMFVGAGFYEHVLSRKGGVGHDDTAFWCTAAVGVAALLAICGLALVMGYAFNDWPTAQLLAPLGIASLFAGFAITREAELLRDGEGKRVTAVLVSAETLGLAALGVSLWLGAEVASLVIARIVNQATLVVGYAIASKKFLPRMFDRAAAREMGKFSIGMLFARFVGWADGYGGDMLLAAALSNAGLGLYRMGGRLYLAGAGVLLQAPATAALAYISKARETSERRMQRVCLRTVRLHAALVLPLFSGLGATAFEIVPLFLGDEWGGVAQITALFCLLAPSVILSNCYCAVLVARGQTRLYSVVNAVSAALGVTALFVGALQGPAGAAAAKAIASSAFAISATLLLGMLERERRLAAMGTIFGIVAAAGALWLTTAQIMPLLGSDSSAPQRLLRVVIAGSIGMAVYVVALRILTPRTFKLVRRVLLKGVRRLRPRPAPAAAHPA